MKPKQLNLMDLLKQKLEKEKQKQETSKPYKNALGEPLPWEAKDE